MSNAVVQFQPQTAAVPAFTLSDMERIASAIAKGGMFGSKDPFAVLTLCMVAQAEGKHPAIVFRDYDLIQGKPAKKAQAMQADFLAAGGRIEWHQLDDEAADATFSHPAGGSVRITWDMDRAKTAGLASKDMWKKFPRQMLRSRTISEGVRSVFPGATSGFYETSEVQDIVADKPAAPAMPEPKRARDLKAEVPAIDDKARAKAEGWVDEHLAALADAATAEDLDAIIEAGAKAVAKLSRDHADLHLVVTGAYERRAADLTAAESADGDDFAGE